MTAATRRRTALLGAVVGGVPFVAVLWNFSLSPLRTAEPRGFASNFFDVQARRLMNGHLTMPPQALGIESFVVDGRTFMYFPPFPAILRMPILALTDRFDGRLTALSMLLAWALLAAASYRLIWLLRGLLRGDGAPSRAELAVYATLMTAITGGSLVVFLASHPWVYHEAYLWSIAFTMSTLTAVVAMIVRPRTSMIVLAGLFALGAILTRTTAGWPMCLMVIAVGIWFLTHRGAGGRSRPTAYRLMVAGGVPLLIGSAVNWAKFRHPFLIPLASQTWTEQNYHRRLALAFNDGTLAGPQFLPTTLLSYFRPDGIRFVPYLPFVTLPASPPTAVGGAFFDQVYRTGSAPAFMPLLFLAAVWACVIVLRRRAGATAATLRIPLIGSAAVCGVVLTYGYLAHRYLSEFMPVLIFGGIIGVIDLTRRADLGHRRVRRAWAGTCLALCAFGVWANVAVGVTAAEFTRSGHELTTYVSAQLAVSAATGHPLDSKIEQRDALTGPRPADTLQVVGNCSALYISSGESYKPWSAVELRDLVAVVDVDARGPGTGVARLFSQEFDDPRFDVHVTLELDGEAERARLRFGEGSRYLPGGWFDVEPGTAFEIRLTADTAREIFEVSTPLPRATWLPLGLWDHHGLYRFGRISAALPPSDAPERLGVTIGQESGPMPPVCRRVLDRVG